MRTSGFVTHISLWFEFRLQSRHWLELAASAALDRAYIASLHATPDDILRIGLQ